MESDAGFFLGAVFTLTLIAIIVYQGLILLYLSTLVSAARSFNILGTSTKKRARKSISLLLRDTMVCLGIMFPTMVAIAISSLSMSLLDLGFLGLGGNWLEVMLNSLLAIVFIAIYAFVGISLTWLVARYAHEVCMLRAD